MKYLKKITPGRGNEKGEQNDGGAIDADDEGSVVLNDSDEGNEDKSTKTSRFKKDWKKEQEALNKLKTSAMGYIPRFQVLVALLDLGC